MRVASLRARRGGRCSAEKSSSAESHIWSSVDITSFLLCNVGWSYVPWWRICRKDCNVGTSQYRITVTEAHDGWLIRRVARDSQRGALLEAVVLARD